MNLFLVSKLCAEILWLKPKLRKTCYLRDFKLVLTKLFVDAIAGASCTAGAIASLEGAWRLLLTDISASFVKDPACYALHRATFKIGIRALFLYRLSTGLRCGLSSAKLLTLASSACGVEIGAGAKIGSFFVLDHAFGAVIGQQSEIGSNVLMMHGVTLGAVGSQLVQCRRHPRIGSGVCLGANSTVLGSVSVGHCGMVAAGAVLNRDVLPYNVAVGSPAKLVS